jgi:hypothetical protein
VSPEDASKARGGCEERMKYGGFLRCFAPQVEKENDEEYDYEEDWEHDFD